MRFTTDEKPFEIRPSIILPVLALILKFLVVIAIIGFAFWFIPYISGIDYSFIFEFVPKTTIISVFSYSTAFVFILLIFIKTLELASTKLVFMNEGFEYHYGWILVNKKQFFYANVIRINYTNGTFYGDITIELSGTDLLNIIIPNVRYPGATTARIKKKIDDSVSSDLYDRIKGADKSLEEETAEKLISVVKSEKVNKNNLATNIEHALDGEKISKNVFEVVLEQLLKSGKISKSDLSQVMFSMYERGLITKKDIADVLFYLNNI